MAASSHIDHLTNSLRQGLSALDDQQKIQLIQRFWPGQTASMHDVYGEPYDIFFEYVRDELARIHQSRHKYATVGLDTIFEIVQVLYKYRSSTFEVVLRSIEREIPNVDRKTLPRAIELAVRLSLTLEIRCRNGPLSPSFSALDWHGDRSLDQVVAARFCTSPGPKRERIRIEKSFTAAFLVNICRVQLRWSNNLAEHLKFDAGVLTLYQHKICLIQHARYASPIIPLDVVNEALQTMNLLFPLGDEATRQLLIKEKKRSFYGLGLHFQSPPPDLSEFKFWQKEMAELYGLYSDPPRNWTQLFSDSRDKLQYATFWIAVVVLILTMITFGFSSVQMVYSVKQYNLALAQACSTPGANVSLPLFCA